MLDRRDWNVILEVYAREPILAQHQAIPSRLTLPCIGEPPLVGGFKSMGYARNRPTLLPVKLRLIRERLNLDHANMAAQLVSEIESHNHRRIRIDPSWISQIELGKREPDLVMMSSYGRLAKIYLDSVVDDDVSVEAFRKRLEKELSYRETVAQHTKKRAKA